jgi:hypothetical protein
MDALKLLFEFFFGKSAKSGQKAFVFITIIIVVVIVNQSMGFTYNFYYSKKIDNVSKLQTLLNNTNLDSGIRSKVIKMQNDIIDSSRTLNLQFQQNRFFNLWYVLSYCGVLLLAGIIAIINTLKTETGRKKWVTVFGIFIIIAMLGALLACLAWLFSYIPIVAISYTLNISFQILCIWAIYYVSQRLETQ